MQSLTADGGRATDWSDSDPSVFGANTVGRLQGEYQICNGHGITDAEKVLNVRYQLFIMVPSFWYQNNLHLINSYMCILTLFLNYCRR